MAKEYIPLLAVTLGDPAGVGPEIIAKVVSSDTVPNARIVCIGDSRIMELAFEIIGRRHQVRAIDSIKQASYPPATLEVLDLKNVNASRIIPGRAQAEAGQAAFEYITRAIDLAIRGSVDGVVTSAICKESLNLAGHDYSGHTEIFAERTASRKVTMMLVSGDFRVSHVSTHCSLKDAVLGCTKERVLDVIRLTHEGVKRMGIAFPRIAVAGLNPHAGESGLFGGEEIGQIQPALDLALAEGLNVHSCPVPADTVFVRMLEGKEFDAVIAQYHDQGHIAAKIVDFWGAVNLTLGLPIIRTSVDHGTAFDIVGTGKAKPNSLKNAIEFARLMALNSRQ